MDPVKFIDLEPTMRMLYDHGNMVFETSSASLSTMPTTNASMREPKRATASTILAKQAQKSASDKTVTGKRNKRPETVKEKAAIPASKPIK